MSEQIAEQQHQAQEQQRIQTQLMELGGRLAAPGLPLPAGARPAGVGEGAAGTPQPPRQEYQKKLSDSVAKEVDKYQQ